MNSHSNDPLAPRAILAGILVATVSGFLTFYLTREKSIHRPEKADPPPSTLNMIGITLNNENCLPQDFYVDDRKVASVDADSATTFSIAEGKHATQSCNRGTQNCGATSAVNWPISTIHRITRWEGCAVSITLSNENCFPLDFYVDGQKVASIAAESEATFSIAEGRHTTRACTRGTRTCGDSSTVDWPSSTIHRITRWTGCT